MCPQILGHQIYPEVAEILTELENYFPSKKLLIHPYLLAKDESGKEVNAISKAVCMPEFDDFIAIWIKQDIPTEEFNVTLTEEALHHIQAAKGYPEIVSVSWEKKVYSSETIFNFCQRLTSVLYDLDAHQEMKDRKLNLKPLLNDDLSRIRNAIKVAEATPFKLKELKLGKNRVGGFPDYLLWWFDLFAMNITPYATVWSNEINPWFETYCNSGVIKDWHTIEELILNSLPLTQPSIQTLMIDICKILIYCRPTLRQKRISGRKFSKLLVEQLVPKEKITLENMN